LLDDLLAASDWCVVLEGHHAVDVAEIVASADRTSDARCESDRGRARSGTVVFVLILVAHMRPPTATLRMTMSTDGQRSANS